ncbi:MAG TPA: hypothetical protein VM529_25335 [Gemmata sp.]|nr:hypothetical protein [Gemmata sp.]
MIPHVWAWVVHAAKLWTLLAWVLLPVLWSSYALLSKLVTAAVVLRWWVRTGEDEGRPYDLSLDAGHFFLFEELDRPVPVESL